jgi:hypothetical protein
MAISFGWQITKDKITGGGWAIVVAPALFFVSSLIHNYVWVKNSAAESELELSETDQALLFVVRRRARYGGFGRAIGGKLCIAL